jgi:hypothetical protein
VTWTEAGAKKDLQWTSMTFKREEEYKVQLDYLTSLFQELGVHALLEEFFLPDKVREVLDTIEKLIRFDMI